MAYGHAERNLATLRLLQQKADELLEQQKRERPGRALGRGEAAGDSAGGTVIRVPGGDRDPRARGDRDPRARAEIPPRDARPTG